MTTLNTLEDLSKAGLIAKADVPALSPVAARYAIAITPDMAALIDRSDPHDPIARQFVPSVAELDTRPEELADPIGDQKFEKAPGVVHRYRDRVLLKLTHACPVYCRFCFRREMVGPGGETILAPEKLDAALAYIAGNPKIWEVILTGGDPFILTPRRIADVTRRLAAIPHVKVLRWHTRVPVVDPSRITDDVITALSARHPRGGGDPSTPAVYIGLHANHPREFTPTARAAIARIVDAGVPMVSQTVLLKGINDDADTLEALMRTFVELRITPYYLHHADLAPGTHHFRTTIAEGQALMRELRRRLSGLALPTYILDIPGGHAKVPLDPAYLDGETITAPDGTRVPLVRD